MPAGRLGGLLRDTDELGPPTFLELFFDIAFVFAFSQLIGTLLQDVSWRGAYDTAAVVCALWWLWLTTVWLTERLDAEHLVVQTLIVVLMFGALVLAAAVPGAFFEQATAFAACFVAIRLVRGLFLLLVTRMHRLARATLLWAGASAPLWLAGGVLPRDIQEPLWAAAIVIDYTGTTLGWPLPGRGRAREFHAPVPGEHLAERCRQFMIIALGDTVLVIAARFGEHGLSADRWLAFICAFITTVLFWRIYIYRAGEMMHHAITASSRPSLFQHGAAFAHLIMVLGVVLTGVSLRLTIDDPHRAHHPDWILIHVSGPAIFLAGRSLLEFNVFGRMSLARPAGLAFIVALYPLALVLPQVATIALIDVVLLAIAVADQWHWRRRPIAVRGHRPNPSRPLIPEPSPARRRSPPRPATGRTRRAGSRRLRALPAGRSCADRCHCAARSRCAPGTGGTCLAGRVRHRPAEDRRRQNSPSALAPASPYGARHCGTYRCEPHTSRVGASSGPTSVRRNSASRPRALERRFTK